MTASAEWTPRVGPRSFRPLHVTVHRYKPEHEGEEYEYLPNVRCDGISHREGANPPTARFAYVADERARALGWPCDFESILRLSQKRPAHGDEKPEAAERYIVRPGSRIVVLGSSENAREGERPRVLFDGFARSPQATVGPRSQAIGFDATGVAERLWDEPIHRVVVRDAGNPESTAEADNVWAPVRAQVNPDYRAAGLDVVAGNCTPDEHDMPTGEADSPDPADLGWPCFVDSTYARERDDPLRPVPWTLERLARYLMWAHNGPRYGQDQQFVDNPDPAMVKKLLDGRRPLKGKETYDPASPATYTSSPIVLPEIEVGGGAWPEALNAMLVHHGFAMCFRVEDGGDGLPWNTLELYRKDGSGPRPPVSIPFQRARSTLDTNRTAIAAMSVGSDFGAVFNGVIVDTRLSLYEISVVLAPAFEVSADDVSAANLPRWRLANLAGATAEERNKYRLWVCEEVKGPTVAIGGDRKWTLDATTEDPVLDLAKLWGDGASRRRRPGRMPLLCRDAEGRPRQSVLSLSKDYAGPVNDLWDETGTWQMVAATNGWKLLPDRLGIRIDCEDPEAWNIGVKTAAAIGMNGVVKLVTATANPNEQNPALFLRLTTVIEGDERVAKPIGRRASSPLRSTRYRIADARESFGMQYVHVSSPYVGNTETTGEMNEAGDAIVTRDDAEKVAAYGRQVQQASENPPVAGTITIPWFAPAYRVGDLIKDVAGRDLSLQANAATEAGEAPRYPYVVGVDYGFGDGGQATVLHLSDKIAEPAEEGQIR